MGEVRLPVIQSRDQGSPPIFEKVAILGLGLIGGSIALAARQIWPQGLVIAVDNKDVLEQAMVKHAIDVAADDPYVIGEADLVILAAPVRQNLQLLSQLEDLLEKPAVVTDVGSTKRSIVEAARQLPARLTFIGGHPMGGSSRGGFDAARLDLFRGRPWIFTPRGDASGGALEKLFAFAAGPRSRARVPESSAAVGRQRAHGRRRY
jgi:prephenate dehydrogenase